MDSLSLMLFVDLLMLIVEFLLVVELLFLFLKVVDESFRGDTERRIFDVFVGV